MDFVYLLYAYRTEIAILSTNGRCCRVRNPNGSGTAPLFHFVNCKRAYQATSIGAMIHRPYSKVNIPAGSDAIRLARHPSSHFYLPQFTIMYSVFHDEQSTFYIGVRTVVLTGTVHRLLIRFLLFSKGHHSGDKIQEKVGHTPLIQLTFSTLCTMQSIMR